ncbi:MAG: Crp/Fnr family transcriptional regulator [Chloroflexi bacterium]|nr:Crp/Fnr family transcriptional regulator [Chloroflexota bacterium]
MGDEVRGVYAVQAGLVNICVITPEGRICSPSPTFPGEPFSLVEAISHVPHVTCALPVIRTTVWFLDLARFTDLLLDDHSFALNVLRLVSGRLLQYVNQTENLAVLCATSRVVQFLLRAAAEVGREEGGNIVVEPMPTHEDIAELTGITRSSATRLLNALERKGIIVAERKQIKIVDPTRLMALSEVERGGSLGVAPTSAPDC